MTLLFVLPHLLALELHHADLALAHHAQVAQGLLEALFAPSEAGDPGGWVGGCSTWLDLALLEWFRLP